MILVTAGAPAAPSALATRPPLASIEFAAAPPAAASVLARPSKTAVMKVAKSTLLKETVVSARRAKYGRMISKVVS